MKHYRFNCHQFSKDHLLKQKQYNNLNTKFKFKNLKAHQSIISIHQFKFKNLKAHQSIISIHQFNFYQFHVIQKINRSKIK